MTDEQKDAMFARWDSAVESGEVPTLSEHQWYGSLCLTMSEEGVTFITAPIEEYDDYGVIVQVGGFGIPANKV